MLLTLCVPNIISYMVRRNLKAHYKDQLKLRTPQGEIEGKVRGVT